MLDYLRSKVVDYDHVLRWVLQELDRLGTHSPHPTLIVRLRARAATAEGLRRQLQTIVQLQLPRLFPRALPMIHDIEFAILELTSFYLPGLEKETSRELALRDLLLRTVHRCGLTWVDDIVVRLDGELASVSSVVESPVIFAPPHIHRAPWELAGLYHEFGHNVFRRLPRIGSDLAAIVGRFYRVFRAAPGPLTPAARLERDRAIDTALRYWTGARLDELFCDIFATVVCGPAHYVSCIDMAVRLGRDPFHVDHRDEHPPTAARVYACHRTLTDEQHKQPVVGIARANWDHAEQTYARNAEYQLFCPQELLDQLVDATLSLISALVPGARRYGVPTAAGDRPGEPLASHTSLEDLVNAAVQVLVLQPASYRTWADGALSL